MSSANRRSLLHEENATFKQAIPLSFRILCDHWKPLVLIALAYYLACFAVGAVIGLILVAGEFGLISKLINQIPGLNLPDFSQTSSSDLGYTRRLFGESSIPDSSLFDRASRVLQEDAQNAFSGLEDIQALLQEKGFLVVVGLFLLFVLIIMFIASVYEGAVIHAVAEVYGDETPNASKSLTYGCSTVAPVYFNTIIYVSTIILVGAISVGIPLAGLLSDDDADVQSEEPRPIFFVAILGFFIFYAVVITSSLLFTATAPAIVIEKASAVGAFMRSARLCKRDMCALFCVSIVVGLGTNIFASILMIITATIGIPDAISHPIINLPVLVYIAILKVVFYMILRVKHEKYTKEELCQDLLNKDGGTIVNAIELSDYEEQKMTIS